MQRGYRRVHEREGLQDVAENLAQARAAYEAEKARHLGQSLIAPHHAMKRVVQVMWLNTVPSDTYDPEIIVAPLALIGDTVQVHSIPSEAN